MNTYCLNPYSVRSVNDVGWRHELQRKFTARNRHMLAANINCNENLLPHNWRDSNLHEESPMSLVCRDWVIFISPHENFLNIVNVIQFEVFSPNISPIVVATFLWARKHECIVCGNIFLDSLMDANINCNGNLLPHNWRDSNLHEVSPISLVCRLT